MFFNKVLHRESYNHRGFLYHTPGKLCNTNVALEISLFRWCLSGHNTVHDEVLPVLLLLVSLST